MKSTLIIPKEITVGYQERNDTYTNKLAYVIFKDNKGKLRQELSWNKWRDHKCGSDIFENKPTDGFVLNKGVQRDYYHWSGGRSMVRIYDPRGIEFEITIANLMYILQHVDANRKGLDGEFVYSWDGKNLVLLPTVAQEYKDAIQYTKNYANKISLKDLKFGSTYQDRKNNEYVYLGRHDFTSYNISKKIKKKKHAFVKINDGTVYPIQQRYILEGLTSASKLIVCSNEDPHPNLNEITNFFNTQYEISPVKKITFKKVSFDELRAKADELLASENYIQQEYYRGGFYRNKVMSMLESLCLIKNMPDEFDYDSQHKIIFSMCAPRYLLKGDDFDNDQAKFNYHLKATIINTLNETIKKESNYYNSINDKKVIGFNELLRTYSNRYKVIAELENGENVEFSYLEEAINNLNLNKNLSRLTYMMPSSRNYFNSNNINRRLKEFLQGEEEQIKQLKNNL